MIFICHLFFLRNLMMIRKVTDSDIVPICTIYNYYIEHTVVTFETKPITQQEMATRVEAILRNGPFIVAENEQHRVVGYAYLHPFHEREAFKHTMETSIYLDKNAQRKGYGRQLFQTLFSIARNEYPSIHALIACITLPNQGSVALHEKFGFQHIARFKEVGYKFDRWLDVGYWEYLFDRT